MEFRVGLDLVSVADVRRSIAEHGDSYLNRLFTAREIADCDGPPELSAARLAARYAAKEATIKVLQPAVGEATPWAQIEVVRAANGETSLTLSGRCATLAEEAGLDVFAVSLTHEGEYAAATVVGYQTGICKPGLEPASEGADD